MFVKAKFHRLTKSACDPQPDKTSKATVISHNDWQELAAGLFPVDRGDPVDGAQ